MRVRNNTRLQQHYMVTRRRLAVPAAVERRLTGVGRQFRLAVAVQHDNPVHIVSLSWRVYKRKQSCEYFTLKHKARWLSTKGGGLSTKAQIN